MATLRHFFAPPKGSRQTPQALKADTYEALKADGVRLRLVSHADGDGRRIYLLLKRYYNNAILRGMDDDGWNMVNGSSPPSSNALDALERSADFINPSPSGRFADFPPGKGKGDRVGLRIFPPHEENASIFLVGAKS